MHARSITQPRDETIAAALADAVIAWTETLTDPAEAVPGRLDPAVLKSARDMGLFGLTLPLWYGGSGLTLGQAAPLVAAVARRDRALASMLAVHLGLGTRALVIAGSLSQRERWLPSLAAGDEIAAFTATEPDAGSDWRDLGTRADRYGGGYVLRGSKVFVSNGGVAGLYTVLAALPDAAGGWEDRGLFLVPRDADGLCAGPEEEKLGLGGLSATSVHLDDVMLSDGDLLGDAGRTGALLDEAVAWGRTLTAAVCAGTARKALELARAHTASRRQFGRTLDALPVVADQLADLEASVRGIEALVAVAAMASDDRERAAIAAKVFASEAACAVVDRAMQLHGGYGLIEASGMPALYRDIRVARVLEGANDVLLGRLGALTLTDPGPALPNLACGWQRQEALAAARARRDPLRVHALGRAEVAARAAAAARGMASNAEERRLADRLDQGLVRPRGLELSH